MKVQFFDDPTRGPVPREDVRFKGLGLFLYEDRRRVAVGFDITPFRERPNIEVSVKDEEGREVASLHVIEALEPNFNLTMHIKGDSPPDLCEVEAILYYTSPENQSRMVVDTLKRTLDTAKIGEQ